MAFLVKKSYRPSFLLFLNCFRANQMGFKQVFDNLTVKLMDALRKQIQSLADYVLNHWFGLRVLAGFIRLRDISGTRSFQQPETRLKHFKIKNKSL